MKIANASGWSSDDVAAIVTIAHDIMEQVRRAKVIESPGLASYVSAAPITPPDELEIRRATHVDYYFNGWDRTEPESHKGVIFLPSPNSVSLTPLEAVAEGSLVSRTLITTALHRVATSLTSWAGVSDEDPTVIHKLIAADPRTETLTLRRKMSKDRVDTLRSQQIRLGERCARLQAELDYNTRLVRKAQEELEIVQKKLGVVVVKLAKTKRNRQV